MQTETIELTNELPARCSLLLATIWFFTKIGLALALTVIAAKYINIGLGIGQNWATLQYSRAVQAVTRTEIVREYVRPEQLPVSVLIPTVAERLRVPRVALEAIVLQESAGGTQLYRFEPDKYEQLKPGSKVSDSEVRMLASSHGVAHVMGFNSQKRCGVHWSRLYDTITGLECGAKILRENLDRYSSKKDPAEKLWFALRDYNGSGPAAERYADTVMGTVGKLLYSGLKEEL